MTRGRLMVYRCTWATESDQGEACGFYFAANPTYADGSPRVFGDDASHDECHHRWPLDVATEVAERYNSFEPIGRTT